MKRFLLGSVMLICSSCANAQEQEPAFDFENPTPLECAANFNALLMFSLSTVSEENDLEDGAQSIYPIIFIRNKFIKMEVRNREIEGMFPEATLTDELLTLTIQYTPSLEAYAASRNMSDEAKRELNRDFISKCMLLIER